MYLHRQRKRLNIIYLKDEKWGEKWKGNNIAVDMRNALTCTPSHNILESHSSDLTHHSCFPPAREEVKEFIILRAHTAETPKQPGISTIPLAWNVVYFMWIWAQRWGTCRLQIPPPFTSINSPVFTTAQTGSTTHLLTHGLQRHVTVHAATISEQMSPQSV